MIRSFCTGILSYNTELSMPRLSSFPAIDQIENILHLGCFLTSFKQLANLTSTRTGWFLPSLSLTTRESCRLLFFLNGLIYYSKECQFFFFIRILISHFPQDSLTGHEYGHSPKRKMNFEDSRSPSCPTSPLW